LSIIVPVQSPSMWKSEYTSECFPMLYVKSVYGDCIATYIQFSVTHVTPLALHLSPPPPSLLTSRWFLLPSCICPSLDFNHLMLIFLLDLARSVLRVVAIILHSV